MEPPRKPKRSALFKLMAVVFVLGTGLGAMGVYLALSNAPAPPAVQTATPPANTEPPTRSAEAFDLYAKLENVPLTDAPADEVAPQTAPLTQSPGAPVSPATVPPAMKSASPAPATTAAAPPAAISSPPPNTEANTQSNPAPAAQASSLYLQLASLGSASEAEALKAQFANSGHTVMVSVAEHPTLGTRYRVRVGPYASKEEAMAAKTALAGLHSSAEQAILAR